MSEQRDATSCETVPATEREDGYVDIVFDGPPGPESGRFIEVENESGESISIGQWVHRVDGYWVLRVDRGTVDV